jgi:ATP-dependent DNA helicase RecG
VHRDYGIEGAKCQIEITSDTITIKSPGAPLPPITLVQLQSFSAPMLSRNPKLQYVFARMSLANERGLGMKTLRTVPEKLGLPLPRFSYQEPYLVLTLFLSSEATLRILPAEFLESLNEDEKKGWEFLASKTSITRAEYEKHMGFDKRKAQRHLKRFVEIGFLRPFGAGPAVRYEVVQQ